MKSGKRPNGAGSVEVLPDGRARIRARVNGKRTQIGPLVASPERAAKLLAAWNAERDVGTIVAGSELTLAQYGDEWLDRRELSGSRRRERVRSIQGERSVWSRQVKSSAIAALPLSAIRPRDVDAFALELRARKALQATNLGTGSKRHVVVRETSRPLSRAQQREALRLVRAVLDEAVRAELIERNPAERIHIAPGSLCPRDLSEDWLRWDEIVQLLRSEAIAARDRRAFACAIGLALRADDLRAIEVTRVDLDCEVPGPGIAVLVGKTQRWHRVPIMPWLVPVIREQLASLPKGARYLFCREDGGRYGTGYDFGWSEHREKTPAGTSRVKHPSALARAGIARKTRFHDLRGTCATHLALGTWGRTWSLHEIQAMLAHSDQRVTERYVRRAVDSLAKAAAATPGAPELGGPANDSGERARLASGGPGLPMKASGSIDESPCFTWTPRPGLEPGTNRLTAPEVNKQSRALTGRMGHPWATPAPPSSNLPVDTESIAPEMVSSTGTLTVLARALIVEPSSAAALALASAVLDAEPVRLALEVQAGGPHAARRAIELAALILAKAAETAPRSETG